MLGFERDLVATLTSTRDPAVRARVEDWVEGSLRTMPEFLRLGVLVETVAFSAFGRLRGRGRGGAPASLVDALAGSPIPLVRQYVRLFRSLVLFAEEELTGTTCSIRSAYPARASGVKSSNP
jgi:hypothetical protein